MSTSILNVLQYGGIRALTAVAQALPYRLAVQFATGLAGLVYRLDVRHRAVGFDNLRLAYGDRLPDSEMRRIVRGVYRHLFTSGIELLFMTRRLRSDNWEESITVDNREALQEAIDYGRGVVFVTGHFGNWEIMGAALSGTWVPLASVARPLRNPLMDGYLRGIREGFGQRIVPKRGALRKLARMVQDGAGVAFLVDQNVRRPDLFVPFFGVPAATTSAFAAFAYRFGCPVVSAFCRRVGHFKFQVTIGEPIYPDLERNRREEVGRITMECTRRLESAVRECPEQWLWLHRRWKTRPTNCASSACEEAALA